MKSSTHIQPPQTEPGATEETLELIIRYLWQSACSSVKTYVVVPVEPEQHQEYVALLLFKLRQRMPPVLKHVLGICTHVKEPVDKKDIHLIFVEKGRLKPGDFRLWRDFVVDLNIPNDHIQTHWQIPEPEVALGTLVAARTFNSSPERFFHEIDFWRKHLPEACQGSDFIEAIDHWVNKAIDRLSKEELAAIPDTFIEWGQKGTNPHPYVMLLILRKATQLSPLSESLNLRYYLGSYRISDKSRKRAIDNIVRVRRASNDLVPYIF